MSFLTPVYILSALAVGLPVLFHLIRRMPRDRVPFGSLLLLRESPPRMTRRSRLEHIWLLLLRSLVLVLLALAFARPFLRQAVPADLGSRHGRLVALLVDTSASMRREDLWRQAIERTQRVADSAGAADQVALLSFERQVHRLVGFDQWLATPRSARARLVGQQLRQLAPTWAATDLGEALAVTADLLENYRRDEASAGQELEREIVLVSDLQSGSRLTALEQYEWPEAVRVRIEIVRAKSPDNAGIALAASARQPTSQEPAVRVRVANAADSQCQRFGVVWQGSGRAAVEAYVPPGQSRVVRLPVPPSPPGAAVGAGTTIMLEGDRHDFDNVAYVVPPQPETVTVYCMGGGRDGAPGSPAYFLQRAFPDSPARRVRLVRLGPQEPLPEPHEPPPPRLIVAFCSPATEQVNQIRRYLAAGGTVLAVPDSAGAADWIGPLLGAGQWEVTEADVDGYAMLTEIDFTHPLFRPFADPRFSDFTKVHFWHHRRLPMPPLNARVLAQFDDSDPALIEVPVGSGLLFVLAAGWHPDDSQLALSSKFVPLLHSILDIGQAPRRGRQYEVGDAVRLSVRGPCTVRGPDDKQYQVAFTEPETFFRQTWRPGIHTVIEGKRRWQFAVNLAAAESRTDVLPAEELERRGVRLALPDDRVRQAAQAARQRQLMAAELERRQKLWRWLIAAALVVLAAETYLAGRLTFARPSGS